jgi:hypothetical protein
MPHEETIDYFKRGIQRWANWILECFHLDLFANRVPIAKEVSGQSLIDHGCVLCTLYFLA